jgi:hypothetical protein
VNKSGRNNACPCCGRTKDADCRWTDDVIFCHCGSTSGPDQTLKVGDTINIDGAQWALVKTNGGFDGAAFVFKPHQDRSVPITTGANRQDILSKQAKRSIASHSLERFFDAYRAAWDVRDFHILTPHQLSEGIKAIEGAALIGRELNHNVATIWREHPDLRDLHRGAYEACLTSINAQLDDLAHFRTHYLGESPAEVMR